MHFLPTNNLCCYVSVFLLLISLLLHLICCLFDHGSLLGKETDPFSLISLTVRLALITPLQHQHAQWDYPQRDFFKGCFPLAKCNKILLTSGLWQIYNLLICFQATRDASTKNIYETTRKGHLEVQGVINTLMTFSCFAISSWVEDAVEVLNLCLEAVGI